MTKMIFDGELCVVFMRVCRMSSRVIMYLPLSPIPFTQNANEFKSATQL